MRPLPAVNEDCLVRASDWQMNASRRANDSTEAENPEGTPPHLTSQLWPWLLSFVLLVFWQFSLHNWTQSRVLLEENKPPHTDHKRKGRFGKIIAMLNSKYIVLSNFRRARYFDTQN